MRLVGATVSILKISHTASKSDASTSGLNTGPCGGQNTGKGENSWETLKTLESNHSAQGEPAQLNTVGFSIFSKEPKESGSNGSEGACGVSRSAACAYLAEAEDLLKRRHIQR